MLALLPTLAGIAWDPTIRGLLTVLVGIAVLFGSVWLIVATNTGARVGTLIALSALFGWMAIMGLLWWVYGIGWAGDPPTWETVDVNRSPLAESVVEEATSLPDRPTLIATYGTPFELVQQSGNETAIAEFDPELSPEDTEGLTEEEVAAAEADARLKAELITYSEIAAVAPEVIEDAGMDFGGWDLLSTAESGEAQAQASADLIEVGEFDTADEFKFLEAYDIGGKPRLDDDPSRWDRIALSFENAVRLQHPTRYAVVQVQRVIEQEAEPGQAPPRPQPDEAEPVISVIMVRDLGDRRVPPALFTIGSLLIFLALCYVLHTRDKELMRRRAAFEAGEEY